MLDCLDREIRVGDTVAVAGRYGSSTWIDKKTVVAVDDSGVPTLLGDKSRRKYLGSVRAIMVINPSVGE